jgi:hypothetical protein
MRIAFALCLLACAPRPAATWAHDSTAVTAELFDPAAQNGLVTARLFGDGRWFWAQADGTWLTTTLDPDREKNVLDSIIDTGAVDLPGTCGVAAFPKGTTELHVTLTDAHAAVTTPTGSVCTPFTSAAAILTAGDPSGAPFVPSHLSYTAAPADVPDAPAWPYPPLQPQGALDGAAAAFLWQQLLAGALGFSDGGATYQLTVQVDEVSR